MNRLEDPLLKVQMLHNIDFAIPGISSVFRLIGQHPERRPGSSGVFKFGTYFNPTVPKGHFPLGIHSPGQITSRILQLTVINQSPEVELSIFDRYTLNTIGHKVAPVSGIPLYDIPVFSI